MGGWTPQPSQADDPERCRRSVRPVPAPLSYSCTDSATYVAQFPPENSWSNVGGPPGVAANE